MWMRLGLADVMANDYQKLASLAPPVNINIYGPRQTQELVDVAFRYINVPYSVFAAESSAGNVNKTLKSPFVAHDVQEGLVYQDDKIRVTAVENSHYSLMPARFRKQMKSYSYRFVPD